MKFGTSPFAALCAAAALTLALQPALAASADDLVAKLDKDSDKTLDLNEVKAAASAHFDRLDTDADHTLDAKELSGIVGQKTFKQADPDNDGTIDKAEYLKLVEQLFKKADVDHDGTLDAHEFSSKSGAALRRLID
jgi:hypothetical protein